MASEQMLSKLDRQLLGGVGLITLCGVLAAWLGLARSPLALFERAFAGDVGDLVGMVASIGGFFATIYLFAYPQWRRWLSLLAFSGVGALSILGLGFASLFSAEAWLLRLLAVLMFAGLWALGVLIRDYRISLGSERRKIAKIFAFYLGLSLLYLMPQTYLDMTVALHPETFDLPLFHFDSTLGFSPSVVLGQVLESFPGFKTIVNIAYLTLPLGFAVLFGLQLSRPGQPRINFLAAWLISDVVALVGYHLLPACGPKYLFDNLFPWSMPAVDVLPFTTTVLKLAPRNAVPSMHFGWALMLWLNARLLNLPWARAGFAILLGLNIVATLGLGEHYLVDLVVAIPVIIAVQALCMFELGWGHPVRRRAIAYGLGGALLWILFLRFGISLFKAIPGLSWAAMAATVVFCVRLYRPLEAAFILRQPAAEFSAQEPPSLRQEAGAGPEVRWVALLFIVSGFAGLVYEVLFSKALALTFGSTATATYTVLAIYMGGMAIGSWLGGRVAEYRRQPLLLYAAFELLIGIYCAFTPQIFHFIRSIYVVLAGGFSPDDPILLIYRVLLGGGALLLPTILMGMTLPILVAFYTGRQQTLGRSVAVLYGANTVGAAFGALLAGYIVIPALGVSRTTLVAALLNLVVALVAIELHKRYGKEGVFPGETREQVPSAVTPKPLVLDRDRSLGWQGRIALFVLAVGGFVTLAVEVNYLHLLAVIAGNSTYAFSLMLFTFLLGLALGSQGSQRLLKMDLPLARILGWLELGLAIVLLGAVFYWEEIPAYFASYAGFPKAMGFGAREFVRGVACWLVMFPPAVFIGAIYPVAMECIGRANGHHCVAAMGRAAAVNTVGNILGALAGGFLLLPVLGALHSVQFLALLCVLLAISALYYGQGAWRFSSLPVGLVVALFAIQPETFDYDKLASGANVYFAPQSWGKVVDHSESVDGGLTAVAMVTLPNGEQQKTLLTNGKFQGNDSIKGEMQAQIGFALAPLLHTNVRERALVIGYGTGVTTRALNAAGFKQVDMVDLSADIVRMANKHFQKVNGGVTTKNGVNTYVTDGRNFLLLQDKQYDLIGLEISSIWFAGAASLYNREFYQLVNSRLAPHGVLQQWVQLHHLSNQDILRIIGSVRSEFRYVWLYLIGGQGIIVATNDASRKPDFQNAVMLKKTPALGELLGILDTKPEHLLDVPLLDPGATDKLLAAFEVPASSWVSTDDNLYLEYSTPKGNVSDGRLSFNSNLAFIGRYSGRTAPAQVLH